ncbi:MAG: MFS transporter [Alphaproteobacteria bacterium]|nr:MFS transporter [Alphaproteobacteria bacterium]
MAETASPRAGIIIVAALCTGYVASQFYRSANAVIASELMAELSISPESMGAITGVFFLTFALMQVPTGVLLDRFGPRIVMPAMLMLAVAGSVIFAMSESEGSLAFARGLMGVGCAAGLMGSMVVFARWFPQNRFGTLAALIFSVGGIGNLLATTPLAATSEAIGWRGSFVGMAAITVGMAALLYAVIRDAPPGHPALARKRETAGQVIAGLGQVLREKRLWYVSAMQFVGYPVLMTIGALWAGPYLTDVHGLDAISRGNVLLAINVAIIAGVMAMGPLDRIFDTRKWIVAVAATATAAILGLLTILPDPPLWQAVTLLILFGLVGPYQMVLHAHARAIFPEHLIGRGLTVQNTVAIGAVFLMQWLSGFIVERFADAADPAFAYRVVFGFLAAITLLALLVYLRIEDAKPSMAEAG